MNNDRPAPLVRIVDVHKAFGAIEVLRGISLMVNRGEAVCVIGPSGSGKSTLLRCINGLIPVDRGEVFVGAHAVHRLRTDLEMIALRKDVSIVFQQYNLFPHKTALENIMMAPVQVLKQAKEEVEARAHELLKKVRLGGKENSRIDAMSITENTNLLQPVLGVITATLGLVAFIDAVNLAPCLDFFVNGSRAEGQLNIGGGQPINIRRLEGD